MNSGLPLANLDLPVITHTVSALLPNLPRNTLPRQNFQRRVSFPLLGLLIIFIFVIYYIPTVYRGLSLALGVSELPGTQLIP